MASIHARIPKILQQEVLEAKRRGDEKDQVCIDRVHKKSLPKDKIHASSVITRNRPEHLKVSSIQRSRRQPLAQTDRREELHESSDADTEDEASASKENDPSLSPSPVAIESPRIPAQTKRPLSDLPTPTEPGHDPRRLSGLTPEQDMFNRAPLLSAPLGLSSGDSFDGLKLVERGRSVNHTTRALHENVKDTHVNVYCDEKATSGDDDGPASKRICSREGKENGLEELGICGTAIVASRPVLVSGLVPTSRLPELMARKPTLNTVVGNRTVRPRIGLRRL